MTICTKYREIPYMVDMVNHGRLPDEAYIKKYEDTSRYDTRNYQFVISMDDLSEDDAAEIILDYIDRTSK